VAFVAVLILVIPIVEIYLFIQVSDAIGFWNALGILILVSLFGVWVVKRQGARVWARFNEQVAAGGTITREVADGVCLLLAGALLIVPGFVTDAVGLLLLLPPVRALARRIVVGRYSGKTAVRVITASYGRPVDGATIDTTATESTPAREDPPRGQLGHP
jgi:UPF0716 protein FxsA